MKLIDLKPNAIVSKYRFYRNEEFLFKHCIVLEIQLPYIKGVYSEISLIKWLARPQKIKHLSINDLIVEQLHLIAKQIWQTSLTHFLFYKYI